MSEGQVRNVSKASDSENILTNSKAFIYGLQHVFGMCAGILAVPIMIGNEAKVTSTDDTYKCDTFCIWNSNINSKYWI